MFYKTTLIAVFATAVSVCAFSQTQNTEINNTKLPQDATGNCKSIISTKLDLSNNSLKFMTQSVASNGITLYWKLEQPTGHTLILRKGIECTELGNEYVFYFQNEIIALENIVPKNCLGFVGFEITEEELAIFKNRPIDIIEWNDNKLEILPEKGEEFLFHCDCISKVELMK